MKRTITSYLGHKVSPELTLSSWIDFTVPDGAMQFWEDDETSTLLHSTEPYMPQHRTVGKKCSLLQELNKCCKCNQKIILIR